MSKKTSQHKFSFLELVFFGISAVLGSGLFLSTAKAYQVGSYHTIWIVILAATIATIMALTFAEMGGRFTQNGGVYLYAKESFGKSFAFHIGFLRFLIIAFSLATEAVALPTLLSDLFPIFKQPFWGVVVAGIFLLFLFYINYRGSSSNAKMAKVLEIIVLSTIVVFVVTAAFHMKKGNFISTLLPGEDGRPGSLTFSVFSSTFLLMFYAFLGFENIGTGAQDIENPRRNIPRAIITTMLTLGVLYFLVYVSVIGVLGPNLLVVNNAIGAAGATYLGPWAEIFVLVVCMFALVGIGLSQMFSGARSLAPIAEDRFFSERWAQLNSRGVPARSLVILALLSFIFVLFGKYVSQDAFVLLVSCTTIGRILQYITVSLGVLVLRKKRGISEGYQMRFAKILVPIVVLLCIGFIVSADPKAFLTILGLIILTILVYVFYSRPRARRMEKK